MRLFGSDRIVKIMERFGLEEGEELQHPWLTKSIETAQRRVEQHHFSIRKRTLEYDDVMNKQREVIYGFRRETLFNENCQELIFSIVDNEVFRHIEDAVAAADKDSDSNINREALLTWLNMTFPIGFKEDELFIYKENGAPDEDAMCDKILARIKEVYMLKCSFEEPEALHWLERNIILNAIDRLWQDHLYAMDNLRSSIGLRAYAQKDPLVEYKQEAFKMFDALMQEIDQEILTNMFRSATSLQAFEKMFESLPQTLTHPSLDQFASDDSSGAQQEQPAEEEITISFKREVPKVGRNDKCPCGSGKKYKNCCGK